MNPLKFLFDSIRSVHYDTILLEACDWSEERVEEVRHALEKVFSDILDSSKFDSFESVKETIENTLAQDLDRKEVDACLHIVSECLSTLSQLNGAINYEN